MEGGLKMTTTEIIDTVKTLKTLKINPLKNLKGAHFDMDSIKIETIAKPIARHFWSRLDEIDRKYSQDDKILNKTYRRIDDLVDAVSTEKASEIAKVYKDFDRLPKWLQIYVGNSHRES